MTWRLPTNGSHAGPFPLVSLGRRGPCCGPFADYANPSDEGFQANLLAGRTFFLSPLSAGAASPRRDKHLLPPYTDRIPVPGFIEVKRRYVREHHPSRPVGDQELL